VSILVFGSRDGNKKKPVQLAAERVSVEGRFSCIY